MRAAGVTSAVGSELQGIADLKAFIEQPSLIFESISGVLTLLQDLGVLEDLIKAIADDINRQQEINNPYERGTAQYADFQRGWYHRYIVGKVGALVVPAGFVSKGIKGGTLARKLDSKLLDGSLARRLTVDGGVDRGRIAVKLATGGSAPRHYIREATIAGQAYQLWWVQRQTGFDIDSVDPDGQSAVVRFVARNGDDGARLVADGGDDAIEVIRRFDSVDDDTADRLAGLYGVEKPLRGRLRSS